MLDYSYKTISYPMTKKDKKSKDSLHSRRDFLGMASCTAGILGAGCMAYPFVNSMNPADDVQSGAEVEVDLSSIQVGQATTVMWRGKPVFIRRRTAQEIEQETKTDISKLIDPQQDQERVKNPEWLVVIGVCTHLGCVPSGQKATDNRGKFGGWFCPCHGSAYDASGRVRQGPAPRNLEIPPYVFLNKSTICIGKEDIPNNV